MGGSGAKARADWIDVARGITISLVVFGHVVISSRDAGLVARTSWWECTVLFGAVFHMPVFMFLSGLFVQSRIDRGLGPFLRTTFATLIWPYLVWGALALIAEQLGKGLRSNVDTSAVDVSLLWTPIAWLWFLWALAVFHVLALLTHRRPMLLVALGLAVLPLGSIFKLAEFPYELCHFLIFYALGVVLGRRIVSAQLTPSPLLPAAAVLGAAVLAWWRVAPDRGQWWSGSAWALTAIPASVAGVIGLCALAMQPRIRSSRLLQFLGKRSLPIYVNHIFFIAAARIVATRVLGVVDFFPAVFMACLVAAFAGPLVIYELAAWCGVTLQLGLGKPLERDAIRRNRLIVESCSISKSLSAFFSQNRIHFCGTRSNMAWIGRPLGRGAPREGGFHRRGLTAPIPTRQ